MGFAFDVDLKTVTLIVNESSAQSKSNKRNYGKLFMPIGYVYPNVDSNGAQDQAMFTDGLVSKQKILVDIARMKDQMKLAKYRKILIKHRYLIDMMFLKEKSSFS